MSIFSLRDVEFAHKIPCLMPEIPCVISRSKADTREVFRAGDSDEMGTFSLRQGESQGEFSNSSWSKKYFNAFNMLRQI